MMLERFENVAWHTSEKVLCVNKNELDGISLLSPRHTEVGTVSLPASSRCVRVSEVGPNLNHYMFRITSNI